MLANQKEREENGNRSSSMAKSSRFIPLRLRTTWEECSVREYERTLKSQQSPKYFKNMLLS